MGLNGFKKSVTTTFGGSYSDAVWKVDMFRTITTAEGKRVSIHFQVWQSEASKAAGDAPVSAVVEDTSFVTHGTDYDTYFAPSVVDAADKNNLSQAYEFAKARLNDPGIVDIVE